MHEKTKISLKIILWSFIVLSILGQLSNIAKVLNLMLTEGDPLPLQVFLNKFNSLWILIDAIWSNFLSVNGYKFLFMGYIWGGFTYAFLFKNGINYLNQANKPVLTDNERKGRMMSLIFAIVFIITIIIGWNRENWVPYVQMPVWEINMVHKQQLSAGNFLIVFLFFYFQGGLNSKAHEGVLKLYRNTHLLIYIFAVFMLENLGSFDWFGWGYFWGYEEIFLYGQTLFSFDKVFHFTMSSALTIILLMFISKRRVVVSIAVFMVLLWEFFEISLNPLEASDSLFDMLVNSTSIIITALFLHKFERD